MCRQTGLMTWSMAASMAVDDEVGETLLTCTLQERQGCGEQGPSFTDRFVQWQSSQCLASAAAVPRVYACGSTSSQPRKPG